MKMKKKVVILGAGPSGLAAAYKLLKESKEYDVTILEKSKEIGGLCKTIDFNKNKIDYGVHFYRISEYEEINKLIYNLIPIEDMESIQLTEDERKKYVRYNKNQNNEDNIMLINKVYSNIYFNNKYYDYPIKINIDTIKKMGFINLIGIGFSYLKVLIHKKPEINLENYYINRYGKKFYKMFFLEYTKKVCGVDPKDIDIDWGKQRIRETSLINILKEKIFKRKKVDNEPSLINEYYYPKYGCGKVYEKLEEEIKKMGGKIITDSYATKINVSDYKIKDIEYKTKKGISKTKVDYLINSISIGDFSNLFEGNCIDKKIIKISKELPFRDLILVNLVFSKKDLIKLENFKKLEKDCWVFIQEPNIKFGRIKIANNWSKYMINNDDEILITLEYCCDNKESFCKLKNDEMINLVKKELKYLKLYPKKGLKDYKIIKTKNAYPAYYGTYGKRREIIKYFNQYKQIYFIGRAGQHQYIDMDKAMYTGITAAKNILEGTGDNNIWL